ncbi:hypothetical protein [Cerasicoccus arenae]|uniref:Uncharacterized protein n=1 Tax=Cerasicoccus arenae TaxID=424488 RepID=A0A8J3DHR3_9BACT|nr:hypothetical protein [Cerasicoccus arenae]MBK1859444.1 hypothetical protein [Cerasicoccus arenae]GHB94170.1 hypothetical protein GCM10007047_07290 [Cerasicoccus arenae]
MKPRNLRHRLEKSAKLLVVVQKHLPEVQCQFADDKGENGHLMVRLPLGGDPEKLGAELESRGFRFTRARSPWLGAEIFRGTREDQPKVIIEVEIPANRLSRGPEVTEQAYSFKSK